MRVLHVVPSLAPSSGGPSLALPAMAKALETEGVRIEIATTDDGGRGQHMPREKFGPATHVFRKQTEFYKVSLPLAHWLQQHIRQFDLVHVHAVFSFASTAACSVARRARVPYVVRPLGVLNQYGMTQRRAGIKAWSFRLLDKPLLNRAAALHYTSSQEKNEAARLALQPPAYVIPLGLDFTPWQQQPQETTAFFRRFPDLQGRPIVLFLSRLDPKKGLELLLEAFASLAQRNSEAALVIVGGGEPDYVEKLKQQAEDQKLAGRVIWTGPLEGEMKLSCLAAAQLFCLPSLSENFGIALLEAMAAGLACLASPGVALAWDAAAKGGVRLLDRDPIQWAEAMQSLLANDGERNELGATARRVAQEDYSLPTMGASLKAMYGDILSCPP